MEGYLRKEDPQIKTLPTVALVQDVPIQNAHTEKAAGELKGRILQKTIYLIRGERVILDRDLAELCEVQTKALNQAVRRNHDRFPSDFWFS